MAVLHGLPSLTLWHQQSNLRQHTKGCATPVLTIPRCTDGGVLGSMHRPAGRRAPLTIAASAKNCDQPVGTICPSAWDRLLAASMFLWPICEGSWRLAVVFARIVQYHALDWLVWINMHSSEVKASNDQAALHAITQACQALYHKAAAVLKEILQLGADNPSVLVRHGKVQSLRLSAGHYDSLLSLIYMAAVSSLASAACTQQRQHSRRRQNKLQGSARQEGQSWFRMPHLVVAASTCALLLRLSLVSMQGASGLAQDTYKFVAVSLTLASVCTGLAQLMQVVFGRFDEDGQGLRLLVQQASNIAWLHCALSLSDWVLMISMPSCLPAKLHVGLTTAITFSLVQTLRHTAQNTNWLYRQ